MQKAVVVFSGGQDSTTVLGVALDAGCKVYPIAFNYGQKHSIELNQAQRIINTLKFEGKNIADLKIVDVREFGKLVGSKSALLHSGQDVTEPSLLASNLPASFVPNRNAMFLTMAHGYAQIVGADLVYTGVCETDYSGYPDCRNIFVRALEAALNTGYQTNIQIRTPLMHLNKAETFHLAEQVGILDLVIEESHTCYNGVRHDPNATGNCFPYIHEWGQGCGECPACKLRAAGWGQYKAQQGEPA